MGKQDTIAFFEKLLSTAENNLAAALLRGDLPAAKNIRQKITHYQRALKALEGWKEGR